ncbi:hypothetical protein HK102_005622 [Quaeritorhiza haematococci]|nr:hypothetical protein HK102_005622 [Quaeritorhiza haematococci]
MANLIQVWDLGVAHIRGYVFGTILDLSVDTVLRKRMLENEELLRILNESFGLADERDADNKLLLVQGMKCIHSLALAPGDSLRFIAARWFLRPLLQIVQKDGVDRDRGKEEDDIVTEAIMAVSPILETCLNNEITALPAQVANIFAECFVLESAIRTFLSRCSHPLSDVRMYAFVFFQSLAAQDIGQDVIWRNEKAVDMMVGYLRSPSFRFRVQSSMNLLRLISSNKESLDVKESPYLRSKQRKPELLAIRPQMEKWLTAFPHSVSWTTWRNAERYHLFMLEMSKKLIDFKLAGSIASEIIQTAEIGFLDTATNQELLLTVATELESKSLHAAICKIHYYLSRYQRRKAAALARSLVGRYPNVPYLYFVAAIGSWDSPLEALPWCERGLSVCEKTCGSSGDNLHVKLGLLQIASECCIEISATATKWDTRLKCITSAHRLVEEYVKSAPPDARILRDIYVDYIWLTLVIRGNSYHKSPEELVDWLNWISGKLVKVAGIAECMYPKLEVDRDNRSAMVALILKHKNSLIEWARRFQFEWHVSKIPDQIESDDFGETEDFASMTHDIARVLEQKKQRPLSTESMEVFARFQVCLSCGNSSVKLKRCSGCGSARYCDEECQKKHWKEHKKHCRMFD